MNKSQRFLRSIVSMTGVFVVFSFVFLARGVYAASTIGTNMSTTGTLTVTPATNSTTSIQFQNAASSTYFYADSTNSRIGVGGAPSTVFEVQGTASASYFFTTNTLQAGGTFAAASVAYSRFGIDTTGHSLAAADDVLFTGLVEFNDNAFFDARVAIGGAPSTVFEVQGTASASYFFTTNTLQAGGTFAAASVAYSRFGADTTGHTLAAADDVLFSGLVEFNDNAFFDARVGIGAGAPATKFEVQGTASASYFFTTNTIQAGGTFAAASVAYSRFGADTTDHTLAAADDVLFSGLVEFNDNAFFDTKVSVSGNFETTGRIRAGTASHSFIGSVAVSSNLVLGTASGSVGLYTAEFSDSAVGTASFLFAGGGNSASTTGTCFQLKDNTGKWVYMSINGHATTPTINLGYVRCHP